MFYTEEQLYNLGLKKVGKNVLISDKCSIYSPHLIEIGDNVRIDDFTVLSPGKSLVIGNHVHIACFCLLLGKESIVIEDFVGLSGRVSVYTSSDDYTGEFLTNPTVPDKYKRVNTQPVIFEKHSLIGTNSTILPGSILRTGTSLYAHSLISNQTTRPYSIYAGVPAVYKRDRSKKLLILEEKFKEERYI